MMSVHYSDQKALSSSQAKREVLQLFFDLVRLHAGARAALDGAGATLPFGTFTWEDLACLHHHHTTRPSFMDPLPPPPTCPCLISRRLSWVHPQLRASSRCRTISRRRNAARLGSRRISVPRKTRARRKTRKHAGGKHALTHHRESATARNREATRSFREPSHLDLHVAGSLASGGLLPSPSSS